MIGNTIYMGYATFQLPNGASMDSTTTFTNVDAGVIPVGAPAEIDTFGQFDNFGGTIVVGGGGSSMLLDVQQDPGPPVVAGSLVNDGVISATGGATLTIQTGSNAYFYNDATVLADGGTVTVTAPWRRRMACMRWPAPTRWNSTPRSAPTPLCSLATGPID